MQPVVVRELPREHLEVPHRVECDAGVLQGHGDGVVPGRRIGGHVHGHPWRLLERHRVHVARLEKAPRVAVRSEEHTSELQSPYDLVCRLLLEKKKQKKNKSIKDSISSSINVN